MSILLFLLVLSGLVLIHEAGHYLAARWAGVKPEEFGIGFPPRAIGWTKINGKWQRVKKDVTSAQKTIWSINWLPLGGFVRLKGEQGDGAQDSDSFLSARLGRKFVIIAAGVFMNLLLATLIFTGGYAIGVPVDATNLPGNAHVLRQYVEITQVVRPSPAEMAGVKAGDQVLRVENQAANDANGVRTKIHEVAESQTTFRLTVLRNGEEKQFELTPATIAGLETKGIGVAMADTAVVRWPLWRAPIEGLKTTWFYTTHIVQGLGSLVHGLIFKRHLDQQVSGPLGIAVMTGQVADQGIWALFQFAAILSVNLAVVNFLPIPGLDGGRAIFILLEFARRKRINGQVEAIIHGVGFIALLVLILLVTVQDLFHYGPGIWRGIISIF